MTIYRKDTDPGRVSRDAGSQPVSTDFRPPDEAYERTSKGDVKYRFVIDCTKF
jgi:hypothetical protein